jgi:hypothetical protein
MLNDRRPLLTEWADKLAVRDYVEQKVGRELLTELHLATDDPNRVRRERLPREFALKPTHGSGACLIVFEGAPAADRLDTPAGWAQIQRRPRDLPWDRVVALCRGWLAHSYRGGFEWAYRGIPPRILVEELLLDHGSIPRDYKFFVFHGRARLVQVDSDRFRDHRRDLFRPDWEPLDVQYHFQRSGLRIPKPAALEHMTEVAEALGQDTDFVRVDLYSIGDRVAFGELTNYPGAGLERFSPPSFDEELGAYWDPPAQYR